MRLIQRLSAGFYFFYRKIFVRYSAPNLKKKEGFKYIEIFNGLNVPQNSDIFIHVGLKHLKSLSGDDYDEVLSQLLSAIEQRFRPSAIIVPIFTPSFRSTGVYSNNYSRGEYGLLSKIVRPYVDHRTGDAIHSVGIISENLDRFKTFDYRDTFSDRGFYASLTTKTYILNISTEWFVSTYMHYLEEKLGAPYKLKGGSRSAGVYYNEDDEVESILQVNHQYTEKVEINREKVAKLLEKNQALHWNSGSEVRVSSVSVRDLDRILSQSMKDNPYFLVSF